MDKGKFLIYFFKDGEKNSETEDKNASSSALNGKNYPLASTGLIFGCCLVISFLSFDPENIHASGTLDDHR